MSSVIELFNIHNQIDVLRVLCGLFFIPHVYGKFFVPAALGFFIAAGFKPPAFWMYLSGLIETVLTVLLVFGVFTIYAAWIAAFHLAVAAVSIYRVSGGKWLWNIGGNEYTVFWALCCVLVGVARV